MIVVSGVTRGGQREVNELLKRLGLECGLVGDSGACSVRADGLAILTV